MGNLKKNQPYFESDRFRDVNLEITNICNFNCWFCPRDAMARPLGKMLFDDFKKVIINLKASDVVSNIKIAGIGEPTLHPQLFEMIRFIKEQTDFTIHLTTNASRFRNNEFREKLLSAGIEKITVSLRVSSFSKNRDSVPVSLGEEAYSDGIIRLIRERFSRQSDSEIEIAFFKSSFYCRYVLGKNTNEYLDTEKLNLFVEKISGILGVSLPSYDDFTDNIRSKLQYYAEIPVYPGLVFRFDALNSWTTVVDRYKNEDSCFPVKYGSCMGLLDHFAIFWNGDVSTCCLDFDARNRLGNAMTHNIREILKAGKTVHIAEMLRKKRMPTKTCQICRGGKTRVEKYANILGTISQIK